MKRFCLSLLPFCVVSCGPSVGDIADAHRNAAEKKLASLEAVLGNCRKQPPLAGDAHTLPAELPGIVVADHHDRPSGNTRVIWIAGHDDPELTQGFNWSYLEADGWWRQSTAALSATPPADLSKGDLERLANHFRALADTQYVIVVRTSEYTAPELVDGDKYRLGSFQGEAHLYRLDDRKHLGAMPFAGRDRAEFSGLLFAGGDDPQQNLIDLRQRIYSKILEFAQAHLAAKVKGVDSIYEIVPSDNAFSGPELRRKPRQ